MPLKNKQALAKATEDWEAGRTEQAGRLIFENIPVDDRVPWASSILEFVVNRTGLKIPAIDDCLSVAKRPVKWTKAKEIFNALRAVTLQLEKTKSRTKQQDIRLGQVLLAELVAKIIYNETDPLGPFDEDSGWWIAPNLKYCLDLIGDDEFSRLMWNKLVLEE
jgi:hypothetical protein